jgi:cell division septal protein FtsQ
MVRPRSNISATLNKKRQASLMKKIWAYFILSLIFIIAFIVCLNTKWTQIKVISVSGNSSISSDEITNIANTEINKRYIWIIPTNNILFLRSKEIKNDILNNIKQISSAKIHVNGFNKINISVVERQATNLWCAGSPVSNANNCYFMDSDGLIFESAPQFSDNTFPEYFGLISSENSIGQSYLKNNFKSISELFAKLKNMSFQPQYLNALNEHEYEIYILGGGKIIMSDERSFESALINLQALIDNGDIKTDPEALKKINHIDLRFGNKIPIELNK